MVISKISDTELGEIIFKRSIRAKRMNIKILSERLEVSLPKGFSEKDGMKFVNDVRPKLLKKQEQAVKRAVPVIDENNPLSTFTFQVQVKKSERKDLFSSLKSGVLTIEYPQELDAKNNNLQKYFWNSINYFLRKEAKRILPYRTWELAEKHGFNFSEVKIQSSKTRWGSCNHKKVINLSFYLLLLPAHLIDYVILHELCHTKEMNHSPRFWEWMDKVTDGMAGNLRSELKRFSIPRY